MKIGFDAKRAYHNRTGLGNYSRGLIDAMLHSFPQQDYFLFNPKPSDLYKPNGNSFKEIRPETPLFKKMRGLWRSFALNRLVRRYGLDLYHGLSHELPFGKKRKTPKWVLTVHDLIIFRFPHYFAAIDRNIYHIKLAKACKKADSIVAISQQTKEDLKYFLRVPDEKITVIYQDCHNAFRQEQKADAKKRISEKYSLPARFLLQVGTIEERKNLLLTVRALSLVHEPVKLVVVGKPTPYLDAVNREIKRLGLNERVIFLPGVPFEDLPAIYQLATLFIYPSRYEGFGIPIIEALCSGVPVIAATGSCLEEAGGPGSLYVDPDDVGGLSEKISTLLEDKAKCAEMAKKGLEYSKRFDRVLLTGQLMALYRQTIRQREGHTA